MKDLVWDKTLSVEVPEIDEDHRRLMDLYNLLKHAVADREVQGLYRGADRGADRLHRLAFSP